MNIRTVVVLATPVLLAVGCSSAELKEAGGNAAAAAGDAVAQIAADPSKALTPAGIAVLVGVFVSGFLGRQIPSFTKSVASGTGGLLAKGFGKLFGKKE